MIEMPGARGRSQDILLVEDNPAVCETTADLLRDFGFGVRATAWPYEALAMLAGNERPAVLLSDFTLPGMDGVSLIQAAWMYDPLLPAVLVTGHSLSVADLPHPTVPLLRKPFRAEELRAAIDQVLGRGR